MLAHSLSVAYSASGSAKTYWTVGARWAPPLNLAGMTEKLALATLPSCAVAAPAVPAWVETTKGADNCQHSRVEAPLDAEMAVRLRYVKDAEAKVERCSKKVRRRSCIVTRKRLERLGKVGSRYFR